ncbi:type II toxin-antitoxin system HigB family toxin [Flavobacterium sp. DGU11]|uniref:Type II toxin-antitoxin system HigB family toxin n=1 Tax=Flavobacterium arundinis TaxID=3139143 RepID=A0ABU9HW43_9FLAO
MFAKRIIAVKTIREYWEQFPDSERPLQYCYKDVTAAQWNSPNDLKVQFGNASILTNKRVVFNIHGNSYRLIVDIEYRLKIVFIVWLGTYKEYDKFNAKEISYVKTDKK